MRSIFNAQNFFRVSLSFREATPSTDEKWVHLSTDLILGNSKISHGAKTWKDGGCSRTVRKCLINSVLWSRELPYCQLRNAGSDGQVVCHDNKRFRRKYYDESRLSVTFLTADGKYGLSFVGLSPSMEAKQLQLALTTDCSLPRSLSVQCISNCYRLIYSLNIHVSFLGFIVLKMPNSSIIIIYSC